MNSITDQFIHLLQKKSSTVNKQDLEEAKTALIDFIGCAAYGQTLNQNLDSLFPTSEALPCEIIGVENVKSLSEQAAYVNAFNAHSTELDDGYKQGMTHIGSVVVAAVYALWQEKKLGIDNLLKGIVMGYEATARLARAINPEHKKKGFHTTGTCGAVGAAMGCAFLGNPSAKSLKAVLSSALASASGLLEMQENASQLKAVNAAHAAMAGLAAGRLANSDFESPDDALNGRRGFASLLAEGHLDKENLLQNDESMLINKRYMKLYPACRHCHPAVEAALNASLGIDASNFDKVLVETYALAIKGHDHKLIEGVNSAKLSIPYCVAAAIKDSKFDISTFDHGVDTTLEELLEKIEVRENPDFTLQQVNQRAAKVVLFLKNGKTMEAEVHFAKGDPENPLSNDEIKAKCEALTENKPSLKNKIETIIKTYTL